MNLLMRLLFKFLFILETGLFIWTYVLGAQGIHAVLMMQRENQRLIDTIEETKNEILDLQISIEAWKTNPFYKEKRAREQLQMAHEDDRLFWLDKKIG